MEEDPDVSYYNGEKMIAPKDNLTVEEKLRLLDTHPFFTGRCPNCEMPFPKTEKLPKKFICSHCGWEDDLLSK
ncbi:hypothetical protein [Floridanema evergladense]|uniref:Uncharacterized protein n=1 Tax=Floridaenema evergladense BLCC-F167 TaxID=3153639 RepID=A0ABV4WJ17_9CYAN